MPVVDVFAVPDDFEIAYTSDDFKQIPKTIPEGDYIAEILNLGIVEADMTDNPPRPITRVYIDLQVLDAIEQPDGSLRAYKPRMLDLPWIDRYVTRNGVHIENPEYDGNWRLRDWVKAIGLDTVGFQVNFNANENGASVSINAETLRSWQRFAKGKRIKVTAKTSKPTAEGMVYTNLQKPQRIEG